MAIMAVGTFQINWEVDELLEGDWVGIFSQDPSSNIPTEIYTAPPPASSTTSVYAQRSISSETLQKENNSNNDDSVNGQTYQTREGKVLDIIEASSVVTDSASKIEHRSFENVLIGGSLLEIQNTTTPKEGVLNTTISATNGTDIKVVRGKKRRVGSRRRRLRKGDGKRVPVGLIENNEHENKTKHIAKEMIPQIQEGIIENNEHENKIKQIPNKITQIKEENQRVEKIPKQHDVNYLKNTSTPHANLQNNSHDASGSWTLGEPNFFTAPVEDIILYFEDPQKYHETKGSPISNSSEENLKNTLITSPVKKTDISDIAPLLALPKKKANVAKKKLKGSKSEKNVTDVSEDITGFIDDQTPKLRRIRSKRFDRLLSYNAGVIYDTSITGATDTSNSKSKGDKVIIISQDKREDSRFGGGSVAMIDTDKPILRTREDDENRLGDGANVSTIKQNITHIHGPEEENRFGGGVGVDKGDLFYDNYEDKTENPARDYKIRRNKNFTMPYDGNTTDYLNKIETHPHAEIDIHSTVIPEFIAFHPIESAVRDIESISINKSNNEDINNNFVVSINRTVPTKEYHEHQEEIFFRGHNVGDHRGVDDAGVDGVHKVRRNFADLHTRSNDLTTDIVETLNHVKGAEYNIGKINQKDDANQNEINTLMNNQVSDSNLSMIMVNSRPEITKLSSQNTSLQEKLDPVVENATSGKLTINSYNFSENQNKSYSNLGILGTRTSASKNNENFEDDIAVPGHLVSKFVKDVSREADDENDDGVEGWDDHILEILATQDFGSGTADKRKDHKNYLANIKQDVVMSEINIDRKNNPSTENIIWMKMNEEQNSDYLVEDIDTFLKQEKTSVRSDKGNSQIKSFNDGHSEYPKATITQNKTYIPDRTLGQYFSAYFSEDISRQKEIDVDKDFTEIQNSYNYENFPSDHRVKSIDNPPTAINANFEERKSKQLNTNIKYRTLSIESTIGTDLPTKEYQMETTSVDNLDSSTLMPERSVGWSKYHPWVLFYALPSSTEGRVTSTVIQHRIPVSNKS